MTPSAAVEDAPVGKTCGIYKIIVWAGYSGAISTKVVLGGPVRSSGEPQKCGLTVCNLTCCILSTSSWATWSL